MKNKISILGSTGSVGQQTIDVALRLGVTVEAITVKKNIILAESQARMLRPRLVAVSDETAGRELRIKLADTDITVAVGAESLTDAATCADTVVTAVSGVVGLSPTLAAIDNVARVALANKETLVCAGEIVMERAVSKGAEILPVDSEHSAIFQCLQGENRAKLRKILLTASGGPFLSRADTSDVTPSVALKHPTWQMGAKISIDSATMMNKGLEFIEAMWLFGLSPDEIEVLIHPQSVIHSAVEFVDGSVIAQLGSPDMRVPIQYALTYPERRESPAESLDLTKYGSLTFLPPNLEQFPCLRLAMDCAKRGGTAPAIMNAANEMAVAFFLAERIGFNDIYEFTASAVDSIEIEDEPDLDVILNADHEARKHTQGLLEAK